MAELTQAQRNRTLLKACGLGLVEVNWDGYWKLTQDGREFLDLFDVLRSIDDRAGAARPSSPLAAGSGQAAPQRGGAPKSAGRGDGRSTARGARRNRT